MAACCRDGVMAACCRDGVEAVPLRGAVPRLFCASFRSLEFTHFAFAGSAGPRAPDDEKQTSPRNYRESLGSVWLRRTAIAPLARPLVFLAGEPGKDKKSK